MATEAPPAKRAKRPRNVLLAEFEGLAKADASQALRDTGGDLDKAPGPAPSTAVGYYARSRPERQEKERRGEDFSQLAPRVPGVRSGGAAPHAL